MNDDACAGCSSTLAAEARAAVDDAISGGSGGFAFAAVVSSEANDFAK